MKNDGVTGLRIGLLGLAMVTILACAQRRVASADTAEPDPVPSLRDGIFQVGESRMHLHCEGTGTPTVVFDSGSGSDGTVWGGVVADIAPLTRACSYDRVGLGYSTRTKRIRTSQDMADELHALLQAAELRPPYVLVAHSAGGWNARLFAARHPRDVSGLVLVDAATAGHHARFLSLMPQQALDQVKVNMRMIPDGWDFDSMLTSLQQVAAAAPLGDTPLIVLSRGRTDAPPLPGVTPELASQMFAAWTELQAELPGLSTNSAHVTAPDSGHMMIWQANALVLAGIREIVRVARDGGRIDAAQLSAAMSPSAQPRAAADTSD
jgi:pimeloyl-ACP methyl ester carboxylesterase